MSKFLLALLLIINLKCSNNPAGQKKNKSNSNCESFSLKNESTCKILHLLSDNAYWQKINPDTKCVKETIFKLFEQTTMASYRYCEFTGCDYYSYSLDKSIFKLDLLRLMRHFNCPDTVMLKKTTIGNFTPAELSIIKERSQQKNPVDTSILYE